MRRHDAHLRLAHELGMHLHDLLGWSGPLTHRQFRVWCCWLDEQFNRPSRADHYRMQVAQAVAQTNAAKGKRYRLGDFRIKFQFAAGSRPKVSREQAAALSKAAWLGQLDAQGIRYTFTPAPGAEGLPEPDVVVGGPNDWKG